MPLIAESTSHDLGDPLSSAQVLGEQYVEDDFLELDSISLVSFSDTATASSADDKYTECSRRLYLWSTRFPISRVAKNDLLALLRDVAFPNLPLDWRTLEKRQKAEVLLSKEFSQKIAGARLRCGSVRELFFVSLQPGSHQSRYTVQSLQRVNDQLWPGELQLPMCYC